jgi:hypothetical protein
MGNLTRGSEGKGKDQRQWPGGGGERWRRCSVAAAVHKWGKEEEWRGV